MGRASSEAKNRWNAKNYDRIGVMVPKGRKAEVAAHAAARGESVNGFIGRAITETMERDGGGNVAKIGGNANAPESPLEGVFGGGASDTGRDGNAVRGDGERDGMEITL